MALTWLALFEWPYIQDQLHHLSEMNIASAVLGEQHPGVIHHQHVIWSSSTSTLVIFTIFTYRFMVIHSK